jgi:hypothetical protein
MSLDFIIDGHSWRMAAQTSSVSGSSCQRGTGEKKNSPGLADATAAVAVAAARKAASVNVSNRVMLSP